MTTSWDGRENITRHNIKMIKQRDTDVNETIDEDNNDMVRICDICNVKIPEERIEVLPDTRLCVKCSEKNPPPSKDPNTICARSAGSGRNGFAPSE